MSEQAPFERRIAALVAEYADQAPTDVDPVAMARLAADRRRGGLGLAWPDFVRRDSRLAFALLTVTLLGAALIGLLAAGRQPPHRYRDVFEPLGVLTRPVFEAVGLPDGRVLMFEEEGFLEYYDPQVGRLVPGGTAPSPRGRDVPWPFGSPATALADGRVLQPAPDAFSPSGFGLGSQLVLFDPATGSLSEVAPIVERPPWLALVMAPLHDGRVLVAGTTVELFDPASGTLSPAGPLAGMRQAMEAVPLADGRVLVIGSDEDPERLGPPPITANRATVFDPATGTFTLVGPMIDTERRRGQFTATRLPDGRVLIVGGYGWLRPNTELFDPETGTFSLAGTTTGPRVGHAAALLADGRVLIVGGIARPYPIGQDASAEIYDPASGRFMPAASMAEGRASATAIALADGSVLVLGGPRAEVYR